MIAAQRGLEPRVALLDAAGDAARLRLHARPPRRVGRRRVRLARLRVLHRDLVDHVLTATEQQPHEVLVDLGRQIHRVRLADQRQVLRVRDAPVGLHLDRAEARELEDLRPIRVLRREMALPRRPQQRALHGVVLRRLLEDLRYVRNTVAVAREQDEERERDRNPDQQIEHPAAFGLVALAQGIRLIGPHRSWSRMRSSPGWFVSSAAGTNSGGNRIEPSTYDSAGTSLTSYRIVCGSRNVTSPFSGPCPNALTSPRSSARLSSDPARRRPGCTPVSVGTAPSTVHQGGGR